MGDGETSGRSGLLRTERVRIAPGRWPQPPGYLFDGDAWPRSDGRAGAGRGAAWYVGDDSGDYVLRHFRRGGLAARVSPDRYLATGAEASRAFREFRVLASLRERGLPVPEPAAAGYWRRGLLYRAALLTVRIEGVETLAARLAAGPLDAPTWRELGDTVARVHAAGACHADLNAHNLLVDGRGRCYVIDFDRARLRRPGRWRASNLARLRRSLDKLSAAGGLHFDAADWAAFTGAYAASSSASDS